MATIAVLGTLDSKGEEHAFVAGLIRARGHQVLLIDVGTGGPPTVVPNFTREQVASFAGIDLAEILTRKDRGECVVAMSQAAPVFLAKLAAAHEIDGVISLGGGGGTAIATAAMRALPLGFPKLMVSTLASGNTAHYLGTKDIVMMPSIADIAGLNRLSRIIFSRAAGAICGMVEAEIQIDEARPLVVASMFGNTTACVTEAKRIIEEAGYEVLVFAATGAGGKSMEALIESGLVAGILEADAGRIVVDGVDIETLGEAGRDRLRAEKIGYVFQTFNLLGAFSALENVLIAMSMAGNRRTDPRHHASDLLARVGLGDRLGHRPNQLSSGQQQRVAIARALANGPSVVLADEPTAHVDETSASAVLDLLQSECADRGATLVVSTHDPSVRARFSRVVSLSRPVVPSA